MKSKKWKIIIRLLIYVTLGIAVVFMLTLLLDGTNRKGLYAAIKEANRVLILSGQMMGGEEELLEITDPAAVRKFSKNIRIVPSPPILVCACMGYPEIIWYNGDKMVARAQYHTHDLRWSQFPFGAGSYGRGKLTGSSDAFLLKFFTDHGILWNNVGTTRSKPYFPQITHFYNNDSNAFPDTFSKLDNTTPDKCFYLGKGLKFADCRNNRTIVLLENNPRAEFILLYVYFSGKNCDMKFDGIREKRIKSDILWGFFERGNLSLPPDYEKNLSPEEAGKLQEYFDVLKQKYRKVDQIIPVRYL